MINILTKYKNVIKFQVINAVLLQKDWLLHRTTMIYFLLYMWYNPTKQVGDNPRETLNKSFYTSCLHIFRLLAQKILAIQSVFLRFFELTDKKSDGTICAIDLISVALVIWLREGLLWRSLLLFYLLCLSQYCFCVDVIIF